MIALVLSALLALAIQDPEPPVAPDTAIPPPAATSPGVEEEDPDPEICRSRLVPSTRMGERNRRVTTCKRRSEWAADSRSRMRR